MSETPRDQRELWHEVSRTFEELGEALRVHLSPDAARSPSDPTTSSSGRPGTRSDGPVDPADTESAPWADPARPRDSQGFDDPWAAATDTPPRGASTPASGSAAPGSAAPGANGTATAGAGGAETGGGTTGGAGTGAAGTGTTATGTTATGGGADTTAADATTGTGATGTGTTGTTGTGREPGAAGRTEPGAAGADAGGDGERGWREWTGTAGGRFSGPADWDSARESVRDLGSSVRRIATQAGDAARDPHVRDSAQRAARTLGDAIVTTVEDFATELRERMRSPRSSDTSRPPEPPPVAPIEDSRDDRT